MSNENKYDIFVVVQVDDDRHRVLLKIEKNHKIKVGDTGFLYKSYDKIYDPETRDLLGVAEYFKGDGIVTQIQSNIAYFQCVTKKFVLLPTVALSNLMLANGNIARYNNRFEIDENKYSLSRFDDPQINDNVKIAKK